MHPTVAIRGFRGALGGTLVVLAGLACGSFPVPTPADETAAPATVLSATGTASASVPELAAVAPTSLPAATQEAAQPARAFTVAVVVDLHSEPVKREQAMAIIGEASRLLHPLTSIDILMTDFVEDAGGGSTQDMASRFITAHAVAEPNGLVIFSFGDGGQAKLYGGYSYALSGPGGFRNAFVSPVTGGGQIYVAVVHFSHKYAACGYGGSDTAKSATSLGGECRNKPGTACIQHNGYSMCSDSLTHLYSSSPTYFTASSIVHELMHSFAPGGEKDHYSTPECSERMGYPAGFFDLQESQYNNDMCPYVYEEFRRSYQP